MKSLKQILRDLVALMILIVKANLGISGWVEELDGYSVRGAYETIVFDMVVGFLIGVLWMGTFIGGLALMMIGGLYSFVGAGIVLPLLTDYLGINKEVKV